MASRDYRLFDIQHAVLPTRLPLAEFYDELVTTQRAFYRKHLGFRRVMSTAGTIAGRLARGQTNFVKSLFMLDRVSSPRIPAWPTTPPRSRTRSRCRRPLPRRARARFTSTPRAAARAAPSMRRPSALSRKPAWEPRRNCSFSAPGGGESH